jgi:uncharacterized membrane protein HdeD (DUF308 family)
MFKSISKSLRWRGVLAIAIGVISVAWPDITVGAFVILFAVYAFTTAATDGVRAFTSERAGPVVGYLLLSGLSVTAGVVALAWPGITALVLTLWVGAWAIGTGLTEVILAYRLGDGGGERASWVLAGLITTALGIVFVVRPDAGAVSLATVFGLFSIISGVSALVLSTKMRETQTTAQRLIGSALGEPTPSRP